MMGTIHNVPALVDAGTWDIQSGIVGYYTGTSSAVTTQSDWNAIVGGEVTLPGSQDLSVPTIGSYGSGAGGYWNSLTINSGSTLNLGTLNDGGLPNEAELLVGGENSVVNNNGTVILSA